MAKDEEIEKGYVKSPTYGVVPDTNPDLDKVIKKYHLKKGRPPAKRKGRPPGRKNNATLMREALANKSLDILAQGMEDIAREVVKQALNPENRDQVRFASLAMEAFGLTGRLAESRQMGRNVPQVEINITGLAEPQTGVTIDGETDDSETA